MLSAQWFLLACHRHSLWQQYELRIFRRCNVLLVKKPRRTGNGIERRSLVGLRMMPGHDVLLETQQLIGRRVALA